MNRTLNAETAKPLNVFVFWFFLPATMDNITDKGLMYFIVENLGSAEPIHSFPVFLNFQPFPCAPPTPTSPLPLLSSNVFNIYGRVSPGGKWLHSAS